VPFESFVAAFGLSLPVFDATMAGAPWLGLPILAIISAEGAWALPLAAALLCAGLAAWALRLMARQLEAARRDESALNDLLKRREPVAA